MIERLIERIVVNKVLIIYAAWNKPMKIILTNADETGNSTCKVF